MTPVSPETYINDDRFSYRARRIREEGVRPATCPVCQKKYLTPKYGQSKARCVECMTLAHFLKNAASTLVARAIRLGRLLPPNTAYCADCDKWAEVYDHRDYYRPLTVEAVCMACNSRRGPAHPFRVSA